MESPLIRIPYRPPDSGTTFLNRSATTTSMHSVTRSCIRTAALLLGAVSAAHAAPLFEVSAFTTDNRAPITVTAGSSKMLDFLQQIVKSQGQFTQLDTRDYTATFKFLGVANAFTLTENSTGTAVTFDFAPIGVRRTFAGANDDDVYDQIEDFFLSEGADVIARFWKAIASQSAAAITDGNPRAATASSAASIFTNDGFTSVSEMGLETGESQSGTAVKPRFSGLAIGFNSGRFDAGPFTGTFMDFSATVPLFRVIQLSTSGSILDLEGAKVYGTNITAAVPLRIRTMSDTGNWNWRITPLVGIGSKFSIDLANGAAIWHYGAVNSVDYRVSRRLVVSMVNQVTTHRSIALPAGDVDYDPQINQTILKNGFRVVTPISKRLIADLFAVDTRFLKEAAVDQFMSFGGSLALRVTRNYNLSLGANYDTGKDFKSYSVGLSSAWRW